MARLVVKSKVVTEEISCSASTTQFTKAYPKGRILEAMVWIGDPCGALSSYINLSRTEMLKLRNTFDKLLKQGK